MQILLIYLPISALQQIIVVQLSRYQTLNYSNTTGVRRTGHGGYLDNGRRE
jgi:hypothetical protein